MNQHADRGFIGLLEAAPDAMVCVATDGRIALVNAQAERLFGYRRDELIGEPVEVLVPGELRAAHQDHLAGYLAYPWRRPVDAGLELAGRRKDGSTFPAEISLSAIDTGGDLLILAAVRERTERLKAGADAEAEAEREPLERRLYQAQRLESLGELAGGVAHDFNNLLGVISSYASFVASEIARRAGDDDTWRAVLADIEQVQLAAERAAGLTHQLLAFARRDVIQPSVLNPNDIIARVLKLLRWTLGEHVTLATRLEPHPEFVLADAGQLEQVLVNLAVNARDAMPGGGSLTIETANIDVDEAGLPDREVPAPGRYVSLKVSDTGTGMPPQIVDRAFEPFFTTKPKGQGTGLGLAAIYGIITQAGGDVRLHSEPGVGTTVSILLPAADQSQYQQDAEDSAAEPPRGGHETVLVVEDESALRDVTRRILERHGYQVMVAASGQEAIDAVSESGKRIDALVTDVVMPGMQGRELAERICQSQPGAGILYMSGYTEGLLSARGVLDAGITLIEKPFTEATLLAKVRKVLRRGE
jgi:PAS domain S-box-containing protein